MHDQERPVDPTPQDASPAPRSRGLAARGGRAAAWVAAGAIGATVLTGVTYAATGSGDDTAKEPTSASQDHRHGGPGRGGPGGPGGPGDRGPGAFGPGGDVLHGEYVVKDADGATSTRLVQSGAVTAVSSTSLTVKSTDGFVVSWTIDDDTKVGGFGGHKNGGPQGEARTGSANAPKDATTTIDDLKVGDQVSVGGEKKSTTSGTAEQVHRQPTEAERAAAHQDRPDGRDGVKPSSPSTNRTGASSTGI